MNPVEFICYSTDITYSASEVDMKRYTKLISLVLVLAMGLSIASCSAKRRTGAERIKSDEYAKQENGLETDYTEPTETDVTNPDPTLAPTTDPTETEATPTPTLAPTTAPNDTEPTATTSTNANDGTYDAAYLFVAGLLFVGGNQSTTERFIEASFGTSIGKPVNSNKSTTTPSYTAYTYDCNIVIDGVEFNRIEIDVCDSNSTVFQVSFVNSKADDASLDLYQQTFANKLKEVCARDLTDKSNGNIKSSIVVLDNGTTIDVGDVKDGKNNFFWVSFYNDNYLV